MPSIPRGEIVEPVEVPTSLRRVTLTGRNVSVRPTLADDAAPLYRSTHGDPEKERVWAYLGYGPWASEDEFKRWVEERTESHDPLWFSVLSKSTGEPIGMITILNADFPNRRLELGHIWYVPEAQRTRANTEATYLLLTEAFEWYRVRRAEWKCDAKNERSRQAALRLGFTFEGIFRNHMIVKGRNRDTAWFSITGAEWPTVKKGLEDRL